MEGNTASLWTEANPFEREFNDSLSYVLGSVREILSFTGWQPEQFQGKVFCEIGPGQNIGIPLTLISFGASAVVVDRFLCDWDPAYHPKFYRELRECVTREFPRASFLAFEQVIERGSHSADGLTLYCSGLESAPEIPSASIDVSFSNATFEHFSDASSAIAELGRITKAGGVGFHQTDFRDHRDFTVPLEYLTISDTEFAALLVEKFCSCGNRLRYTEFEPAFERAGFDVRLDPNVFADEYYLTDILSRALPKFRAMPVDALRVLSGRFHLRKR